MEGIIKYVTFSILFVITHTLAYIFAGIIALKISTEIYEGKSRLLTYLKDMSIEKENKSVQKRFIPAQLLRGFLMSLILLPLITPLEELSFGLRFTFFTGLMFVFTHLSSASPSPDNIEGFVYLKNRFFKKSSFFKFQFEMILYSVIFGGIASWILFF
jgi:hypothetical protein